MTEQMKFKMRFVGFKEDGSGELKPTSPGGFKHHEIRELTFEYSLSIWWEIVDGIPDLVIPEPRYKDSVFIEEVFVPPDDEAPAPPPEDEDEPPFIELEASEEIVSHSAEPVQTLTVKVEPSLEPGEAFMVAPGAIDENTGELVPSKFVKIEGLNKPQGPHDTDMIETIDESLIATMTVKDLKARIEELGGEVDSQWRKADLIREARKLEESSSPT